MARRKKLFVVTIEGNLRKITASELSDIIKRILWFAGIKSLSVVTSEVGSDGEDDE